MNSLWSFFVPWGISPARTPSTGDPSGTGSARCGSNGVVVHAPSKLEFRIRGNYRSILPDDQVANIDWTDGFTQLNWTDGSNPGECDTALSSNLLSLAENDSVDWDLHDLSEADNDIGHGRLDGYAEDALGLQQCNARIYAIVIKNRSESEGDLVIGDASSNEWTAILDTGATVTLLPDSVFSVISETQEGLPVDGTNDCNLKVLASGGAVGYGLNYAACSN